MLFVGAISVKPNFIKTNGFLYAFPPHNVAAEGARKGLYARARVQSVGVLGCSETRMVFFSLQRSSLSSGGQGRGASESGCTERRRLTVSA